MSYKNPIPVVDEIVSTGPITLSSANILNLNSTPRQLVAAQGANTVILPLLAVVKYTYGTTTYTTNLDLIIQYAGTTNGYMGNSYVLPSTVNTTSAFNPTQFSLVDNIAPNADLELTVSGGNPLAGDGTLDIEVWYTVLPWGL